LYLEENEHFIKYLFRSIMEFEFMENMQKHLDCPCFQKDDDYVFESIKHRKGVEITQKTVDAALIFVMSGEIEFSFNRGGIRTADAGDFFLLPARADYLIKFTTSAVLQCYYIPMNIDLCWRIKEKVLKSSITPQNSNGFNLTMNNIIRNQLNIVQTITEQGLFCRKYLTNQLQILISYITLFYPVEVLAEFFAPLRFGTKSEIYETNFHYTVLQNKNKFFKVSDFAKAANMSRMTLRRYFEQQFKMTPQQWIMQERVKLIEDELKHSTKTLTQIANLTGFHSVREFFGYCKKHFGKTATQVRKGI